MASLVFNLAEKELTHFVVMCRKRLVFVVCNNSQIGFQTRDFSWIRKCDFLWNLIISHADVVNFQSQSNRSRKRPPRPPNCEDPKIGNSNLEIY